MISKNTGAHNSSEALVKLNRADYPPSIEPCNKIRRKDNGSRKRISGAKNIRQRRQSQSRFFSILTSEEIRACEMIAHGFHLRTAGLGMKTQSFCRQPASTGNLEDRQFELMRRLMRWGDAMQAKGLSVSPVLDIVVFGKSFRIVDRERKKRNGFSRSLLLKGLNLYLKI